MLDNPVVAIVVTLAGWILPFLGLVSINTEYFCGMFGWKDNGAKLASSSFGLLFGGLIALAYFMPITQPWVGLLIFLDICWTGPSGSYDLLIKFAERLGSGKKE